MAARRSFNRLHRQSRECRAELSTAEQIYLHLYFHIFYIFIDFFLPFQGHISRDNSIHVNVSLYRASYLKGILYKGVYVIDGAESGCGVVYSLPELRDRVIGHHIHISTEALSVKPVNMCNICKQQVCCCHMHTVSRVWIFLFVLLCLLLCMCQHSGTKPTVVTINSTIYSLAFFFFFSRPLSMLVKMIISLCARGWSPS